MSRTTIGYVLGESGHFDRSPFYRLRLSIAECRRFDELLERVRAGHRCTATLTASFHQPDRLRVTEIEAPEYERRAAAQYIRGDVVRVQGREGISCGLDVSGQFGIPLIRQQLGLAMARAAQYVEIRVPSRKRDVVEFVPDVDLESGEDNALVSGSVSAATSVLPREDFRDWEK
ncbi:MAG: hypothetical protein M3O30_15155 [Planctomycetota bacterium]|nr:hypothetical protein [Planctomycetota bacterium]